MMPFIEHRGSGRSDHDADDMTANWDREWSESGGGRITEDHESWRQMRRFLPKNGSVLEAGCGLAKWVEFLNKQGFKARGIDFSAVAIQKSRELWPGIELVQGDLRRMPFETGRFQAVVSFGAVEHDSAGPDEALREMQRVLEPGGIMYCSVPCMNTLRRCGTLALKDWLVCSKTVRRLAGRKPEVSFYEFVFTPEEYARILAAAGFEVLSMLPCSPRLDFLEPREGSFGHRTLRRIAARFPWLAAHMVAAICRKPDRRRGAVGPTGV